MPKHHKPKGFIIDQGLSHFNGKPYVAILDLARSTNAKTGDMAQVWILCRDTQPFEATKNGDDETICGNCQFRRQENGTRLCYVNAAWRARQVWDSYKACEYEEDMRREHIPLIQHRKIRWGAYGDPAIINPQVFWGIHEHCAGHTGYTQAWREKWAQPYKGVFMASCKTEREHFEAVNDPEFGGWKTFNVHALGDEPYAGVPCPHDRTGIECRDCGLCDGDTQHISQVAHGSSKRKFPEVVA